MNKYVTCVQAENLKTLGFNKPTNHYYKEKKIRKSTDCIRWNRSLFVLRISAPSTDEAIDWIRREYNIHIYTAIEPFVDPTDEKRPVLYRFAVKYCNRRDGWNGRIYIGETKLSPNVYSLKRQAITLALRWIKKNKVKKLSKLKSKRRI